MCSHEAKIMHYKQHNKHNKHRGKGMETEKERGDCGTQRE